MDVEKLRRSHKITWVAKSHIKYEKNPDWFWIVGIIAFGIAVLSTYFGNILFALLIVIATFVIFIQSGIDPHDVDYELNYKGIVIQNRFYPYDTLESYCIVDEDGWDRDRILIKSKKMFLPLIIVPIGEHTSITDIKNYLGQYLKEEDLHEPSLQIALNRLGF